MNIRLTAVKGVVVCESAPRVDARGSFARLFCANELSSQFADRKIVQVNHSRTHAVGAVRGMHFQYPPHAEWKQVRCLRGRVWDVALDLRAGSSTLLQWHAEELSPDNGRAMVIPEGCAHGFQVLEPDSELLYLHTAYFTPAAEGGVAHDDPRAGIRWPLAVTDISERDRGHARLTDSFRGFSN